jgi:integrase
MATFDEIEGQVWTLPPNRTKTGREHRVPLTDETLALVQRCQELSPNEYLFPALKEKPISDMAVSAFMKREGYEGQAARFSSYIQDVV